ncbi:tyrosine-type recombinase/integrase [Rhodopirellula halodulae]|uniref:tyrosine-type recombinase/integrase n=1 Tax=Rhodopirellula halodulae TaxID=2894198 RepID=UPI0036F1BE93
MGWRDPVSNERRKQSTGARLKSVAKEVASAKEKQLCVDPFQIKRQSSKPISWQDLKKQFLEHAEATKRPKTAVAYRINLKHFTDFIGKKFLHEITSADLLQFAAHRRQQKRSRHSTETVSDATVNKDLRGIRAALNFAVDCGYIPQAPSFRGVQLRESRPSPVVVAPDYRRKFEEALNDPELKLKFRSAQWWRFLFRTIEELGVRFGEALGIQWGKVNLGAAEIIVEAESSKGRRYRTLPLSAELVAVLRSWKPRGAADDALVFPWGQEVGQATRRNLYREWHRIRKAAGIPDSAKFVPKSLRSTCGSEMIASGAPTVVVKDFLGHASVTTTESHYINTGSSLRAASERRRGRGGSKAD